MFLFKWLSQFFSNPEQKMTANTNNPESQFNFTKDDLMILLNKNHESHKWYELMPSMFSKYGITTTERIAGFIAQTAHESSDYRILEENLNYSASALNRIFSKYFRNSGMDARLYHRQPEKIANRVYADRMGNGDEQSGDGWRYRGRGLIQLSGKYNYQKFADHVDLTLDQTVDYLKTKTGALESACWFWNSNDLNSLADRLDVRGMSRRINGGYNGFEDRKDRYRLAFDVLDGDYEEASINKNQSLTIGSRGETVRELQSRLSISQDGIYGPATFAAVMDYQKEHGLHVDGIAGTQTLNHLLS